MNKLSLGEKIEAIIYGRKDFDFGKYMGASAKTFGAARIDGIIYKVERNIEVMEEPWFWRVHNVNTGKKIELEDKYDLPCLQAA
jgi:hypothetical protein